MSVAHKQSEEGFTLVHCGELGYFRFSPSTVRATSIFHRIHFERLLHVPNLQFWVRSGCLWVAGFRVSGCPSNKLIKRKGPTWDIFSRFSLPSGIADHGWKERTSAKV